MFESRSQNALRDIATALRAHVQAIQNNINFKIPPENRNETIRFLMQTFYDDLLRLVSSICSWANFAFRIA